MKSIILLFTLIMATSGEVEIKVDRADHHHLDIVYHLDKEHLLTISGKGWTETQVLQGTGRLCYQDPRTIFIFTLINLDTQEISWSHNLIKE